VITAFEANDDDQYAVYFAGVNTEGSPDQQIGMDIYCVVFNATDVLALINEEQGTFNLTAEILRHPTKAADANYGGFARWVYVDANT
jgi:hypothetical protein